MPGSTESLSLNEMGLSKWLRVGGGLARLRRVAGRAGVAERLEEGGNRRMRFPAFIARVTTRSRLFSTPTKIAVQRMAFVSAVDGVRKCPRKSDCPFLAPRLQNFQLPGLRNPEASFCTDRESVPHPSLASQRPRDKERQMGVRFFILSPKRSAGGLSAPQAKRGETPGNRIPAPRFPLPVVGAKRRRHLPAHGSDGPLSVQSRRSSSSSTSTLSSSASLDSSSQSKGRSPSAGTPAKAAIVAAYFLRYPLRRCRHIIGWP